MMGKRSGCAGMVAVLLLAGCQTGPQASLSGAGAGAGAGAEPQAIIVSTAPPAPPEPPPLPPAPPPSAAATSRGNAYAPPVAPPPPPPPAMATSRANAYAPTAGGLLVGVPSPLAEHYPGAVENPIHAVAEAPVSTFSADVDTASYGNIRRFLSEGRLPPAEAVRVEEVVNYFHYAWPAATRPDQPFQPSVAVYPSPWRPGAQILQIGIAAYDVPEAERPPADLVFLVDTSGSMMPPDRLPLVKSALRLLVGRLRAEDRVALVTYAGDSRIVLTPTPGNEKATILAAIDQLGAGGSTNGHGGLMAAYQVAEPLVAPGRTTRILLATDGDFNVGVTGTESLQDFVARHRDKGVALTVLGVGRGNYNDATAQALAQAGNGNAFYLDSLLEARKVLQQQMGGTLLTVAGDVKFQVEFNPARVAEYRLIGYETRMLREQDFKNDRVDAGEIGSGHRVTALYEIVPPGSPAALLEPHRYAPAARQPPVGNKMEELAWLRIRWKPPGETASRLYERPVTLADRLTSLDQAGADVKLAAAAAAFAQKLRQSHFTAGMGWDQVEALAQAGRGADPDGERAEFLRLVRAAAALAGTEPAQVPGR